MKRNHLFTAVLALFIVVFGYLLSDNRNAFFYGFLIGLVNLILSLFFFFRNRGKIPMYSGQSLNTVIKTVIIRLAVVSGLLVYGLKWFGLAPEALLLGFVLGQLLFLFNQFFMVTTNYGK